MKITDQQRMRLAKAAYLAGWDVYQKQNPDSGQSLLPWEENMPYQQEMMCAYVDAIMAEYQKIMN